MTRTDDQEWFNQHYPLQPMKARAMTDWADETAARFAAEAKSIPVWQDDMAAALRKARQDGELAGLMKAGTIATLEPDFHMKSEWSRGYEAGRNAAATAIYSQATAIRATKDKQP